MDAHTLYTADTDPLLMKKALTDYKEQLIPILNKLRNGQRLTPEEEEDVEWITMREMMRLNEDLGRNDNTSAYEDGKAYGNAVLDSGGDLDDLKAEMYGYIRGRVKTLDEKQESHSVQIPPRDRTAEEKIRDTIRDAADHMGTEPRAFTADAAKIRGIGYAIDDHEPDDGEEFRYR